VPERRTRGRHVTRIEDLLPLARQLPARRAPLPAPQALHRAPRQTQPGTAIEAEAQEFEEETRRGEHSVDTEWYPLTVTVDFGEGVADMPADPPSREEMLGYFTSREVGTEMLVQFRTALAVGDATEWETWKGDPQMIIFDYKRFYMFWYRQAKAKWYGRKFVQLRFIGLPEDVDDAPVWHGEENCALTILAELYKSKARELRQIKLGDDGGFRRDQAMAAAGVLKRNIELRNRLGGIIYETKKEDGTWRYGTSKGPIVLYDYDGHAVDHKPTRPDVSKLKVVPVEYSPEDYWAVTDQYGSLAKLWPLGGEAAVVERREDGPVLIRSKVRYEAVKQRAEELKVTDYKLIASPFGVEVAAWKRENGFYKTPDPFRQLWKAANFFPIPYSNPSVKPGKSVDLNSAYESCAMLEGAAADLREKYGFPSSDGMIAFRDPPDAILDSTGLVVATLDLAGCHPWVQYLARGKERGVYTTMRLKVWRDSGAVVITRLEFAVVAKKKTPTCNRPERARWTPPNTNGDPYGKELSEEIPGQKAALRHWGRQAIGRLIPSPANAAGFDYIYATDQAEAGSLVHMLVASRALGSYEYVPKPQPQPPGPALSEEEWFAAIVRGVEELEAAQTECGLPEEEAAHFDEVAGYHKIGVRGSEDALNACFHAHAYFLDYTAVVIDREIFSHPWSSIARVATDCITLARGEEFSPAVKIGTGVGTWKEAEHKDIVYGDFAPRPDPPETSSLPAAAYWEPLNSDRITIFEGPPGYGKTYHCLESLKGVPHWVLTPTRKMRRAIMRDAPAEGRVVQTWHKALKPGKKFVPCIVTPPRGAILYLPEIGTWDVLTAKLIITWLINEHDCRIIADGDRRQMSPPRGVAPWRWLDTVSNTVPWCATDYRSKTPELAKLKMDLRPLGTNARVFSALKALVGATQYADFCDHWHPLDYVYCARNRTRDRMTEDLRKVHRSKFPGVPLRIRYGEKNEKRSGEEKYIALNQAVPATADEEYVSTYSSCQGETASADVTGRLPRVWLVDHCVTEYFENAAYVAATRVEQMGQLGVVVGAPLSPEELGAEAECARADAGSDSSLPDYAADAAYIPDSPIPLEAVPADILCAGTEFSHVEYMPAQGIHSLNEFAGGIVIRNETRYNGHAIVRDAHGLTALENLAAHLRERVAEGETIHEAVNAGLPLRLSADIDAPQGAIGLSGFTREQVWSLMVSAFVNAQEYYGRADCHKHMACASSSDDTKLSVHIVLTGTRVQDYREVKGFLARMCALLPSTLRPMVDSHTGASRFCLRMVGAQKNGRVKQPLRHSIENGHTELFSYLVQPPQEESRYEWAPGRRYSEEPTTKTKELEPVPDSEAEAVARAVSKVADGLVLRDVDKGFVNLQRVRPGRCPMCNREHTNEGMYAYRSKSGWRLRCRRGPGERPLDVD
jgi:hypothetical protein